MSFENPILNCAQPTSRRVREALLKLARQVGAGIRSSPLPGCDEKGRALACDIIYWGPKEPTSLVVADWSIHGAEGYATAAQCWEILAAAPDWLRLKPAPIGVMIVGPINAYGLVHLDRFNANNVDVNRNFLPRFPLEYENVPYRNLEWAINPKTGNPESLWSVDEWFRQGGIALAQLMHGFDYLVEAIGCGQGLYPKGVQFTGDKPEPENEMIRRIIREIPQSVKRLVWINLHCGLGGFGRGSVLHGYKKESEEATRVRKRFHDLLPPENFLNTNPNNLGAIDNAVHEEMQAINPGAEVTAFALETGTFGIRQVVMGVRARTWARNFGHKHEELVAAIKRRMLHLFYPADPTWRKALRDAGLKVFGRALLGFLERRQEVRQARAGT